MTKTETGGAFPAWQPIATAPKDDEMFLAYCPPDRDFPEGRMMIWRGSILAMQNDRTPWHLRYPATHWLPLPPAPKGDGDVG